MRFNIVWRQLTWMIALHSLSSVYRHFSFTFTDDNVYNVYCLPSYTFKLLIFIYWWGSEFYYT
jgi:hypothetical protein